MILHFEGISDLLPALYARAQLFCQKYSCVS